MTTRKLNTIRKLVAEATRSIESATTAIRAAQQASCEPGVLAQLLQDRKDRPGIKARIAELAADLKAARLERSWL